MDENTVLLHGHFLMTKICMYRNREGTGVWLTLEKMNGQWQVVLGSEEKDPHGIPVGFFHYHRNQMIY